MMNNMYRFKEGILLFALMLGFPLQSDQQTRNQDAYSPISIQDGTLMLDRPIVARDVALLNEDDYLSAIVENSDIKTFSLDVGVNRGQVLIGNFLQQVPHMFVIGIEANSMLKSLFEDVPTKYKIHGFSEMKHPLGDQAKNYLEVRNRAMIVGAAVSSKRGIAHFNPGYGWKGPYEGEESVSDTGSLLGWTDEKREEERKQHSSLQMLTTLIRLDDILRYVPPPNTAKGFMWDTLKIDIQGYDVDGLISAGVYLKNFVCVVGEFVTDNYKIPEGFPVDPVPVLTGAGFVQLSNPDNTLKIANQIWMNRAFKDEYVKDPEKFSCHRVYDSEVSTSLLVDTVSKA